MSTSAGVGHGWTKRQLQLITNDCTEVCICGNLPKEILWSAREGRFVFIAFICECIESGPGRQTVDVASVHRSHCCLCNHRAHIQPGMQTGRQNRGQSSPAYMPRCTPGWGQRVIYTLSRGAGHHPGAWYPRPLAAPLPPGTRTPPALPPSRLGPFGRK